MGTMATSSSTGRAARPADLFRSVSAVRFKIPFSSINLSTGWALMGLVTGGFKNDMTFKRATAILK